MNMRKFAVSTLFFLACLSVFGQVPDRELKLFVLPIAGYGREKDNDYFYKQVAYETIFQYHSVVKSQDNCNYIFKGYIEPVDGVPVKDIPTEQEDNSNPLLERAVPPVRNSSRRREFFSIETKDDIYFIDSTSGNKSAPPEITAQGEGEGYFFILELLDPRTGDVLGSQKITFYVTGDSVSKSVSDMVYNLLSDIPSVPPKRGDSRDRWMYFDIGVLWMPRFYYDGYDEINLLTFGMRLGMEFHFMKYMSLGAAAQVTQEVNTADVQNFQELVLEVPVALKLTFKIGNNYSLEPYGGVAYNYSLGRQIEPSEYSWFAGVQFSIKDISETGMFYIDPRFSMDFYSSSVPSANLEYKRYCIQLGLGYKFGAFQKRK
jgi:hypothetical protein